MPEAKKPAIDLQKISNPQLVEALATLHKENTPLNQGKVLDLVLHHASFLAPVILAPVPKGSNVPPQLQGKTAIQFQLITTKDGRPFFPAFTDWEELRKFSKLKEQRVVMLRFDNYAEMVLKDDRTAGMVINPLGLSLTLDRKSLENMAKKKAELARGYAEEQVEKDTQVMVGDPEEEPEELLDAVCELAEKREEIQRLWLREMVRQDGMKRYIIVVDHTGEQAEVFQAIARPPRPTSASAGGYDPLRHRLCRRRHRGRHALLRPGRIKKDRKCGPENVTGRPAPGWCPEWSFGADRRPPYRSAEPA